ncbi:uncharacterized protein LOC124494034 [Dermatophagoides farinae]|uniref:uncharacterized protein LOC124494034 n=1 Tax=Dermatophagoides farinae TaxID=6954 RepID=UPI003F60C641
MNYLKKKITKVVGNPKRKNDDDDDFDNYVPEIPPHPSTLTTTTTTTTDINDQLKIKFDSTNTNFANFDSVNNITVGEPFPLSFGEQEQQQQQEQPKLSLEELKAKEEEYRKEEREKLRQQEESKKDCEEWKFFLSLTAKADAVTSKTQTVLEKLQTESAVKEISKFEDPTFSDQFDETAPKNIGAWAAFDETADYNPSDPIFQQNQDEQQQQQQQKWQMFELNKDILVRHRPPHKFRNEQNYHHIFIPKQRQLFSVIREINDDSDAGRGHCWCTCCFCCLCTCF